MIFLENCFSGRINSTSFICLGILEHPSIAPGTQEVVFKIGVLGKAGSGKTKTISVLSGKPTVFPGYIETIGIHVKNIYWPAQVQAKTCLFKLQFWESGESCSKRYNYISTVRKTIQILEIIFELWVSVGMSGKN